MDGGGVRDLLVLMERVTLRLFLHPAPTVALINGHAIAGGCLVSQTCDVRIAVQDPKLRIGMTGVAIGLTYPPFVLDVLGARLTAPAVERVLLSADRFDVEDAEHLGLVDETPLEREAAVARAAHVPPRALPWRASYAATKLALRRPRIDASATARAAFLEEIVPRWTAALVRR